LTAAGLRARGNRCPLGGARAVCPANTRAENLPLSGAVREFPGTAWHPGLGPIRVPIRAPIRAPINPADGCHRVSMSRWMGEWMVGMRRGGGGGGGGGGGEVGQPSDRPSGLCELLDEGGL
jgi:hypothetical protein